MSRYEELREQTEAADGDQLSRLGALAWKAYQAGEITGGQLYDLNDVWNRRVEQVKGIRLYRQPNPLQAGELKVSGTISGKLYPEAYKQLRGPLPDGEPEEQVIPLANLRRLDLKPGDRLAVIAPDWADSAVMFKRVAQTIKDSLAEYADIQAIVFPHGTKLDVVSPERAES